MNKCCNNCKYSQDGFKDIGYIYNNPCLSCFMFSYWQPLNYYTTWSNNTDMLKYGAVNDKTEKR